MSTDNRRAFERLHQLLQQLSKANQMLDHGPKRIATAEKKVKLAEQACEEQKATIQQLRKQSDQTSLQLKTSEAEVGKHTVRLNDAKSNKEYEIIQGQIAAAKQDCDKLEDEILDLLNQVDEAESTLEDLKGQQKEAEDKVDAVKAKVAEKEPGLRQEVETVTEQISEAEKLVPAGESTTTYRRLVSSMADQAMAKVEDGYCEKCNSQLTPQDSVQVNLGKFLLCRNCGVILYRPVDVE